MRRELQYDDRRIVLPASTAVRVPLPRRRDVVDEWPQAGVDALLPLSRLGDDGIWIEPLGLADTRVPRLLLQQVGRGSVAGGQGTWKVRIEIHWIEGYMRRDSGIRGVERDTRGSRVRKGADDGGCRSSEGF